MKTESIRTIGYIRVHALLNVVSGEKKVPEREVIHTSSINSGIHTNAVLSHDAMLVLFELRQHQERLALFVYVQMISPAIIVMVS